MDHLPAVESTSIDEIVGGFVPTRRFARVSFDSYVPDPRYASQLAAKDRLRACAEHIGQQARAHLLGRLLRRPSPEQARAVYLDGGYGVGKTHLLAATYHAVEGERRYLSFGELAYAISRLGLEATLDAMHNTRLLCIDEFELDDVAQTRMAATFLRRLLDRRGPPIAIVATSNTLPSDLGRGRFAAAAFQREIGEIASRFEVVSIDGEDFRHRRWDELALATADLELIPSLREAGEADPPPPDARVLLSLRVLLDESEQVHPVHYAQIARQLDAVFLEDLRTIEHQAAALRLVHFVDKLYDQEVRLHVATQQLESLADVFSPSYRNGGYEKKYRRCLSRLHELVRETRTAHRSASGARDPPAAARQHPTSTCLSF